MKRRILRISLVVPLAVLAAGISLMATHSIAVRAKSPGTDLSWRWASADEKAALAEDLLGQLPDPEVVARAEALAKSALEREPGHAKAARVAGVAANMQGQLDQAQALFRYAESLSRRDLQTQLWLIEDRVRADDIDGALRHYNRAMLVSPSVRPTLIPILAAAASKPAIRQPLSALLTQRPLWWADYADAVLSGGAPEVVAATLSALNLDPSEAAEGWRLSAGLNRLASGGQASLALKIYRQSSPQANEGAQLLRDGSFEEGADFPPFEWEFVDQPDLAAIREPRDGAEGQVALTLLAQQTANGELARQLLVLRPGLYQLRFQAGLVPNDALAAPTITIQCAGGSLERPSLATIVAQPADGSPTIVEEEFAIPADCDSQWLMISGRAASSGENEAPWIDALELRRISR